VTKDDKLAKAIRLPFDVIEGAATKIEERALQVDSAIRGLYDKTREMDSRLAVPLQERANDNQRRIQSAEHSREVLDRAKSASDTSGMKDDLIDAADALDRASKNTICSWCARKAQEIRSATLGLATVQEDAARLAKRIDEQGEGLGGIKSVSDEMEALKGEAEDELGDDTTSEE